jgi:predicted dehydrogenase
LNSGNILNLATGRDDVSGSDSDVRTLRVGVVGAGVFGGHHAAKFASLANVDLVGVFDPKQSAAEAVVARVGKGEVFDSFEALAEVCDALVIASPAITHAKLTRRALELGKHALVEKPLALDGAEARSLAHLAVEKGLVLQVGHQERLVFAAMGLLSIPERPIRIEATRMSTRSPEGRCEDVSVVFDLMIHDLDLAAELFGGEAVKVRTSGASEHTKFLDEATSDLVFPGGGVAHLTASRCAAARERHMRIQYPSGVVEIDFLTREVRNETPFNVRVDVSDILPDPLRAAAQAFVAAVRGDAVSPITGGVGARAAHLAQMVETCVVDAIAA